VLAESVSADCRVSQVVRQRVPHRRTSHRESLPVVSSNNEVVFTARRHGSAVFAIVVCLSVCLSQVGVLLKRLNVGSHKQRPARDCSFLVPKISRQNSNGVAPTEAPNAGGVGYNWRLSTSASLLTMTLNLDRRRRCQLTSVVPMYFYHSERPPLSAARLPWCSASRGLVSDSWYTCSGHLLFYHADLLTRFFYCIRHRACSCNVPESRSLVVDEERMRTQQPTFRPVSAYPSNCWTLVFTARRSYASAVLGVVILSVRLSVRHTRALLLIQRTDRRYYYTTRKAILLAFWRQRSQRNSNGVTPNGGAKERCGRLKRRFSTNIWLYLTNGAK